MKFVYILMILTNMIVVNAIESVFVEITDDKLTIIPNKQMLPDKNTMVRDLFGIFDRLPKDDYLEYREIKIFQYLTNPELPLTVETWKWVCKLLGSNHITGIDINAFNSSYYPPINDLMGTDITRDWARVNDEAHSGRWM